MGSRSHAVVLGAGVAGTLAAAALARHYDMVTLAERDHLSDSPGRRQGIPQAVHAHLLWSGGAHAIERLIPGALAVLESAGAQRIELPERLVSKTPYGWTRREPGAQFLIGCSRTLLDWHLLQLACASGNVSLLNGFEPVQLLGNSSRVCGVELRDVETSRICPLEADLVVDATGRGSRAPYWLDALGLPAVHEKVIDPGISYATRAYEAPADLQDSFPLITVQPDPRVTTPVRTAMLLPIERGQWIITVSGGRGGEPPKDESHFDDFARGARDSIVGDFAALATPISPVHHTRATLNRRRYFERLREWPEGFLVVGDALACYNPYYGHGMSAAAMGAAQLSLALSAYAPSRRSTIKTQRDIAKAVFAAWQIATKQDIRYVASTESSMSLRARCAHAYFDRMLQAATLHSSVNETLLGVFTLSESIYRLISPHVLWTSLTSSGPTTAVSDDASPPLTALERSALGR